MELVFNEVSLNDKPTNEYQAKHILEIFAETCSTLRNEGYSKLRVVSDFWNILYFNNIDINSYLSKLSSQTKKSFLRSFIRKPFIADDFISEADEKYAENSYYYNDVHTKVVGLAYAYLLNTIAVSLSTSTIWDNIEIKINEKISDTTNQVTVKNASKPEHTEYHKEWIYEQKPIRLIKTNIRPINKNISLRDDHGKDILHNLANRLVNSNYVVAIINSLPFNPNERNFIRKVYPNGQIEIVLTNRDEGFGLIVQTTGQNLRETTEIGNILEREYK